MQTLQGVNEEEPERVERDRGERVVFPGRLVVGADAHGAEKQTLDGPERAGEERIFSLVDAGHVRAERPREGEERYEVKAYLQPVAAGHESFSGARSATNK